MLQVGQTQLLNVHEAAKKLGCSAQFVRDQIAAGCLKYIKLGRRFMLTEENLEAWILRECGTK